MNACLLPTLFLLTAAQPKADALPWVEVAKDKKDFVLNPSAKPFVPWGFNYDHDSNGRLIEDYWDAESKSVETHFAQMEKLGANVVRIHLQLSKFMRAADKPNAEALDRLGKLLALAERHRLYLDLTGLGCYHKKDVPAWYDKLSEKERWNVQVRFWQAVAARCAESPAVFCYDLMNEPVVPGGKRDDGDWLGPPFAGSHFVQFITLDQAGRPRPSIAQAWVHHLAAAIRDKDRRHLITVGLVDWSLDRPGLTSGFVPDKIAADLDFISVHIYPKTGKLDDALQTLAGFAVGKPVVIEEMFPLACSAKELDEFIDRSKKHAAGWIGFYWGKPPDELRGSGTIGDAMTLAWLELFERRAKQMQEDSQPRKQEREARMTCVLLIERTPVGAGNAPKVCLQLRNTSKETITVICKCDPLEYLHIEVIDPTGKKINDSHYLVGGPFERPQELGLLPGGVYRFPVNVFGTCEKAPTAPGVYKLTASYTYKDIRALSQTIEFTVTKK